jgi:murein DD-endopeptidase MepM/ murein hydrolase activator NlpD
MKHFLLSAMVLTGIILLVALGYFYLPRNNNQSVSTNIINNNSIELPGVIGDGQQNTNTNAEPVADFKPRITKKPFGIYITPQNSPVQPEKFTGYHTAVDVEYQDISANVPVYALSEGKIVLARTASGYGGILMLEFELNGNKHTAIYGHLRPSSLPKVEDKVVKGQQIGLLGTGYSVETDGERRHLHFGILSDNRLDLKGYVKNKSELSGWIDPLTLYR